MLSGVQALLALANELADSVVAVDISARAVRFTTFNAQLNGSARFASRLTVLVGDVYSSLPAASCPFDAILANPPFVAVPRLRDLDAAGATVHAEWALYADGGGDGADVLRSIVTGARDGGWSAAAR